MKIRVISQCYNESRILPFYLRHYSVFADEIVIFDDNSDDGSREIMSLCKKVSIRDAPTRGIDEVNRMECYYAIKRESGDFDWIMFPDIDEFLFAPHGMRETLDRVGRGYNIAGARGYNMVGEGIPKDDGRQIYEIHKIGVSAPVYGKPIVVKPSANIDWVFGRHTVNFSDPISPEMIKLLHYRYMGHSDTDLRNKRNYDRSVEKAYAWSNAPDYSGEHSAQWAESAIKDGFNVMDQPL